jgi:hypothetical protein
VRKELDTAEEGVPTSPKESPKAGFGATAGDALVPVDKEESANLMVVGIDEEVEEEGAAMDVRGLGGLGGERRPLLEPRILELAEPVREAALEFREELRDVVIVRGVVVGAEGTEVVVVVVVCD